MILTDKKMQAVIKCPCHLVALLYVEATLRGLIPSVWASVFDPLRKELDLFREGVR